MKTARYALIICLLAAYVLLATFAQVGPETPRQNSTPDRVETRLGTLRFFDDVQRH